MSAEDTLREWLFRLAWRLRIWHGLPSCIATAIDDSTPPVQEVCTHLTNRTSDFLGRAQEKGTSSTSVATEKVFELITAVSWAVDRFGDDPEQARQRVMLATAGVFHVGGQQS